MVVSEIINGLTNAEWSAVAMTVAFTPVCLLLAKRKKTSRAVAALFVIAMAWFGAEVLLPEVAKTAPAEAALVLMFLWVLSFLAIPQTLLALIGLSNKPDAKNSTI